MKPIRLQPVYKQALWASDYISNLRNLSELNVGISREVCAYKGSENVILSEEFKGKKINEVINEYHRELMGDDPEKQLIRCAYMASKEALSIQVHMTEEHAKLVDDYEKSESWYVLETGENSSVVIGVNTTDKDLLREAILNNDLEKYLIRKEVKEGDFIMVPAGLIHANGENLFVMEIGSFGGITYRMYDYGRGRALDVDRALEVCYPELTGEINSFPLPKEDMNNLQIGVHHRLFHTDVVDVKDEMCLPTLGKYNVYSCVKGKCILECDGENYPLAYTETILIPASITEVTIKGKCRVLRSYKP